MGSRQMFACTACGVAVVNKTSHLKSATHGNRVRYAEQAQLAQQWYDARPDLARLGPLGHRSQDLPLTSAYKERVCQRDPWYGTAAPAAIAPTLEQIGLIFKYRTGILEEIALQQQAAMCEELDALAIAALKATTSNRDPPEKFKEALREATAADTEEKLATGGGG